MQHALLVLTNEIANLRAQYEEARCSDMEGRSQVMGVLVREMMQTNDGLKVLKAEEAERTRKAEAARIRKAQQNRRRYLAEVRA